MRRASEAEIDTPPMLCANRAGCDQPESIAVLRNEASARKGRRRSLGRRPRRQETAARGRASGRPTPLRNAVACAAKEPRSRRHRLGPRRGRDLRFVQTGRRAPDFRDQRRGCVRIRDRLQRRPRDVARESLCANDVPCQGRVFLAIGGLLSSASRSAVGPRFRVTVAPAMPGWGRCRAGGPRWLGW
jgi:hypothetical protein